MVKDVLNVKCPHALSTDDVVEALQTNAKSGLGEEEVRNRLRKVGYNQLEEQQQRHLLLIFLSQFSGIVIWVLIIAFGVALIMREWPEAIAIAAVLLVNTLIGFVAEWRATRTIDALREKEETHACAVRDGDTSRISIRELVPGDIITLEAGELVPADARILKSKGLRINEAVLTGEAEPVSKGSEKVDSDTVLAERAGMLFKGCSVLDGKATAVVTSTGMNTEIGRIAKAAMEAQSTEAPLRQRLDELGRHFVGLVLVSCVFVGIAGWWRGRDPVEIIETAVALGIAAVPEGLPIVATIALAHGMWIMGKNQAVVKQLNSVQTLGSVPILFVDKTGTLTLNKMKLVRVVTPDTDWEADSEEDPGGRIREALDAGVICNGASLEDKKGDPMEIALLEAGSKYGCGRDELLADKEVVRTVEFARDTMMMAVFHTEDEAETIRVCVKGAPERVLKACSTYLVNGEAVELDESSRKAWTDRGEELAGKGYRILAVASKSVKSKDDEPYEDLCFKGFLALEDPLRENVSDSIDECEAAGIKVIMVTGDKPETAQAIARQAGIGREHDELDVLTGKEISKLDLENEEDIRHVLGADVVARVEPRQKMALVEAAQAGESAVGMTGDGVNDAPALKRANIGIAMGERGTEAAKQVADIVLQDDALATIVEAVRRGRTIMDNIRKAVMFFLCTNLAEIIAVTIGAAMAYPLPLMALQILYLNVVTDVFPALALGVGPADQNVMNKRTEENAHSILTRPHWMAVIALGLVLAALTLAALIIAKDVLGLSDTAATTVSFLTLGLSKVWFPFNLRDFESPVFLNEITRNKWVWGAAALCVLLLLAAVYLRPLGRLLETAVIPAPAWGLILSLSLVPLILSQVALVVLKVRSGN